MPPKRWTIEVQKDYGKTLACSGVEGRSDSLVPMPTLAKFEAQGHTVRFGTVPKPSGYDALVAASKLKFAEARARGMRMYDFRVRLANGVTATVCAGSREDAGKIVKGLVGRYGGVGARVSAVARLHRRDDVVDSRPHVVDASALRRFVGSRVTARRPKMKSAIRPIRYQRKKGPFGQARRRK